MTGKFLAVGSAVFALTPGTPDTIPGDMPAKLIWDFRIAYLAELGLMWATLGTAFGLACSRPNSMRQGWAI